MVGVAGRSKGCITCRKRKKGCDLAQPGCGQCKERGIPCDGYDTDRVFVYHDKGTRRQSSTSPKTKSPDGSSTGVLSLRSPEGNVIDSQLIPTTGKWEYGSSTGVLSPRSPQENIYDSQVILSASSWEYNGFGVLPVYPLVLPPSLAQSAYSEKTLEAFVGMYVPRGDLSSTNAEGKELIGMLPRINSQDEALRLAILAIGTLALSKQTNDTYLTRKGRDIYGKALSETRRALQNPSRARSTSILAIPYVMALFEILFGSQEQSGKQAQSWLSHAQGEIALIVARGPEAFTEDTAHQMFVNARWRPLIAACRLRKRSILDQPYWKIIPWIGRTKSPLDSLMDILAGVPEILENVDRWGALSPLTPQNEATDLTTCAKCWTLHIKLHTWLTANEHKIHTPVTSTPTPIIFPTFDVACLTIKYWATCLLLYITLDTASRVPPTDTTISHPDRPHPRHFARLIARAASYFFSEQFGIVGPTTYAFPLGNAVGYLQRDLSIDGGYMRLVGIAWASPSIPGAIKEFLISQRMSVESETYKLS